MNRKLQCRIFHYVQFQGGLRYSFILKQKHCPLSLFEPPLVLFHIIILYFLQGSPLRKSASVGDWLVQSKQVVYKFYLLYKHVAQILFVFFIFPPSKKCWIFMCIGTGTSFCWKHYHVYWLIIGVNALPSSCQFDHC